MKAGAAALAFFLYPLALAEWRCAFVFPCTVQELCRTCSTSLGPSRVSSHWPCWTAGLCAVKMRAAEASQNSKTQLQFRDKDVMWDSVKGFAQVQVNGISCSSLSHYIWQAQFSSCPQSPVFSQSLSIVSIPWSLWEVPCELQVLCMWGSSCLSTQGLICLVSLVTSLCQTTMTVSPVLLFPQSWPTSSHCALHPFPGRAACTPAGHWYI